MWTKLSTLISKVLILQLVITNLIDPPSLLQIAHEKWNKHKDIASSCYIRLSSTCQRTTFPQNHFNETALPQPRPVAVERRRGAIENFRSAIRTTISMLRAALSRVTIPFLPLLAELRHLIATLPCQQYSRWPLTFLTMECLAYSATDPSVSTLPVFDFENSRCHRCNNRSPRLRLSASRHDLLPRLALSTTSKTRTPRCIDIDFGESFGLQKKSFLPPPTHSKSLKFPVVQSCVFRQLENFIKARNSSGIGFRSGLLH